MRKKLLAAFLALVMVFTLLPTWAFATGELPTADDEGVITLTGDVELSQALTAASLKASKLDLAGHMLTINAGKTLTVDADLKIVNSGSSNSGGIDHHGTIAVTNGAVLDISELADGEGGLLQGKPGVLTIANGATVKYLTAWDRWDYNDHTVVKYGTVVAIAEVGANAFFKGKTYVCTAAGSTTAASTWAEAVATVNGYGYATLADAIKAVGEGQTIELLKSFTSGGVSVPSGKNFTLDFNGFTLSFDKPGAGSTGTTTQGFQLLKGSTITFKNGTINCTEDNKNFTWDTSLSNTNKGIAWIINNYATLTLDNMKIDGTNVAHNGTPGTVRNVVNNYAGTINVINGSVITATGSDFAINADFYNVMNTPQDKYNNCNPVTNITDSTINGKVEAISGTINLDGTTVVNGQVRVGENRTKIDKQPGASGATVTIGASAKVTLAEYPVVVFGKDTLNVYGTVESTSKSSTDTAAVSTVGNSWNAGSIINVYDGAVITSEKCSAIYMPNGALTISGGTITGPTAVYFKSTSLSISGGTLTGNGAKANYVFNGNGGNPTGDALVVDNCNYPSGITTPVITGGTFSSTNANAVGSYAGNGQTEALKGFITGGTFSDLSALDYLGENANVTIKLAADVALSAGVDIAGTVTLDLNGKKITPASGISTDYLLAVLHGGDLTVKDSGTNGAIDFSGVTKADNTAIKMTKAGGDSTKTATLTVESGSIKGFEYAISGNGNTGRGNTSVTIKGGTIESTGGTEAAIYNPQQGTLTINGGTIIGACNGVYVKSGNAVVSMTDGTISTNASSHSEYSFNGNGASATGYAFVVDNAAYPGGAPTVAISGGTFNGPVQSFAKSGTDLTRITGFITGGTFSNALEEALIESGYVANETTTGTWTVGAKPEEPATNYVAQIGDDKYESLAAAVKAATGGEIVKLLDNASGAGLFIEKTQNNLTLDLNGFTYTVTSPAVGSAGTETQALHIEAANFTLKSGVTTQGTLTSNGDEVKMLVQNYSNLTVENVILNGTKLPGTGRYVLSNNSGTTTIKNSVITAKDGDFAFDSCKFQNYTIPTVTVTGTTITGNVEATGGKIVLGNGTSVTGRILDLNGSDVTVGTGASVTFDGNNATIYVRDEGSKLTVSGTVTNTYADNNGEGQTAISTNGSDVTAKTITIKAGASITSSHDVAIYLPSGTLNVEGGTITGATAVYFKSTNLSISGGTLVGNKTGTDYACYNNGCHATGDALVFDNCNYPAGEGTVSVTGGTFSSTNAKAVGSYVGNGQTKALKGFISGGTFSSDVSAYVADGYEAKQNGSTWTVGAETAKVAQIENGAQYETLAAAVAAATDGDTVTLLADAEGAGIGTFATPGDGQTAVKTITIDLGGKTYTVTEPPVGSSGTETQGFHLEKGKAVTVKNGTLTSKGDKVLMLVQNYCDLTLDNVTLNGTNLPGTGRYVMSNNSGTVSINNSTITAKSGDFAFDSCKYGNYTAPTVTVTGSTINGKVEVTGGTLNLTSGTVTGDIKATSGTANLNGGTVNGTVRCYDASTVNVNGASITGENGIVVWGDGVKGEAGCKTPTLNVQSGAITGTNAAIITNGTDKSDAVINISGGTIINNDNDAIYAPSGIWTITGGTITGKTAMYFKSEKLSITGGTFTGTGTDAEYVYNGNGSNPTGDALVIDSCNYPNGLVSGNVSISGGTFTSTAAGTVAVAAFTKDNTCTPVTKFITGGTFSSDVSAYVAEGYACTGSGTTYTVAAQVEAKTEVKVSDDKIVVTGEETKVVTVETPTDATAASVEAVVTAINTVLANTEVAKAETKLDVAKPAESTLKDAIVVKNSDLAEADLTTATVTTKISIVPAAVTAEAETGTESTAAKITALTFDVKPVASVMVNGKEYTAEFELTKKVTFRLPVPSEWSGDVVITHTHENNVVEKYLSKVLGAGDNKYVELSASQFSMFGVSLPTNDELKTLDKDIAEVSGVKYKLSEFQSAVNAAKANDATIELLGDVCIYGIEVLDTDGDTIGYEFIQLTKNVNVKRNGFSFYVDHNYVLSGEDVDATDPSNYVHDGSEYRFVFTDVAPAVKVIAEVSGTANGANGAYKKDTDEITVTIKLTDASGNALTSYKGAYVKVAFTEYVTVAQNGAPAGTGWKANTDGTYTFYSDTGVDSGFDGVLGTFKLTGIQGTGGTSVTIADIQGAYYVEEADASMSNDYAVTVNKDNGEAKISSEIALTVTATGKTYDGTVVEVSANATEPTSGVHISGPTYYNATKNGDVYTINGNALTAAPKDAGDYIVEYNATATGYDETKVGKGYTISKATLTVTLTAGDDLVYDGRVKTLATASVSGFVSGESGEVTYEWENQTASAIHAYTVKCTPTLTGSETCKASNYVFAADTVTLENVSIVEPEHYIYYTTEGYMADAENKTAYNMVYVFVKGDARLTYTVGNETYKMYKINSLDYGFVKDETEGAQHKAASINGTAATGYNVYACLVASNAAGGEINWQKFNYSLAGTIMKTTAGVNDVNGSRAVDLADAVAVVTTAHNALTDSQRTVYMATILRADVNRDGKVTVADDGALVKYQVAPELKPANT